jgi:hypothetical protein
MDKIRIKQYTQKLKWTNDDIVAWVKGPAFSYLQEWKTAVLEDQDVYVELLGDIGLPDGWVDESRISRVVAVHGRVNDSSAALQKTSKAAHDIAKATCTEARWNHAYARSPNSLVKLSYRLLLSVLADLKNNPVKSWILELLGGKPLSHIPYQPSRIANPTKPTTRKRPRISYYATGDTESDDSDGPDEVPAVAPSNQPTTLNSMWSTASKHPAAEAELHNQLRKAREERDAAVRDKSLSSKEVVQARQRQRDAQFHSANLEAKLKQLSQVDKFVAAKSSILELAKVDYEGAATLVKSHPEYKKLETAYAATKSSLEKCVVSEKEIQQTALHLKRCNEVLTKKIRTVTRSAIEPLERSTGTQTTAPVPSGSTTNGATTVQAVQTSSPSSRDAATQTQQPAVQESAAPVGTAVVAPVPATLNSGDATTAQADTLHTATATVAAGEVEALRQQVQRLQLQLQEKDEKLEEAETKVQRSERQVQAVYDTADAFKDVSELLRPFEHHLQDGDEERAATELSEVEKLKMQIEGERKIFSNARTRMQTLFVGLKEKVCGLELDKTKLRRKYGEETDPRAHHNGGMPRKEWLEGGN